MKPHSFLFPLHSSPSFYHPPSLPPSLSPSSLQPVCCLLKHSDGTTDEILLNHTMNNTQISWFQEGSALNRMAKMFSS